MIVKHLYAFGLPFEIPNMTQSKTLEFSPSVPRPASRSVRRPIRHTFHLRLQISLRRISALVTKHLADQNNRQKTPQDTAFFAPVFSADFKLFGPAKLGQFCG